MVLLYQDPLRFDVDFDILLKCAQKSHLPLSHCNFLQKWTLGFVWPIDAMFLTGNSFVASSILTLSDLTYDMTGYSSSPSLLSYTY